MVIFCLPSISYKVHREKRNKITENIDYKTIKHEHKILFQGSFNKDINYGIENR